MTDQDVTKHPHWHLALCDECGKPYKLEDLNKKAEALGLKFSTEEPRFHFHCCYTLTLDDEEQYRTIIDLLRRHYGM